MYLSELAQMRVALGFADLIPCIAHTSDSRFFNEKRWAAAII